MRVVVVIRARNAAEDLRECLPAIRSQRLPSGVVLDVVVVDNASTDGTRDVALQHGATVVVIAAGEFTWGRALNRGVGATPADVALLLSADATPADDGWVGAMLAPFADDRVAAVYGRQVARADAPIDELTRLERAFVPEPRALTIERVEQDLRDKTWVCSNACAAIRTSVWRVRPFDEQVQASEELPWIRAVLADGWRACYEPRARVLHSHRESLLRFAIRAWEFHLNGAYGGTNRLVAVPRLIGSMVKQRVRNCMSGRRHFRAVACGLGRLPLECAAVAAVSVVGGHPKRLARLKGRAWGQARRAPRRPVAGPEAGGGAPRVPRVLYSFPHVLGRPGIGTTAWHQVSGLVEAGAEVHVMCSACVRPLPGVESLRETLAIGPVRVPRRVIGADRAWHLHDWVTSRVVLRKASLFDVVHCWPSGALRTLLAAKQKGIRSFLERPSSHTRYVHEVVERESQALGIKGLPRHYSAAGERRLRHEEREFEEADLLLCPSEFVGQTFERFGTCRSKLRFHQYGFDPASFSAAVAQRRDQFVALYCGEGIVLKGLHVALRAWLASGVSTRGQFLIAGHIMPSVAAALQNELSAPSVRVLGFRSDIPELMRRSDVLILPSFAEGSALVTYEARACGCVVLVSDACGARCDHLETGLIHPAGDTEGLASHIRMVADDNVLRARIRQASLDSIETWTWSRAGRVLCEVYRSELHCGMGVRGAVECGHRALDESQAEDRQDTNERSPHPVGAPGR